jgi:TolB-like protein/tetratricopeptide (TPR) repeat protein
MSTTDPVWEPDKLSPQRIGLVRDHLEEVMASHAFAASKRAQNFLQLIVGHALAGQFDCLRERMIGAEMFGRSIDYDTANDSVVRVKATEVRKKLAQYYLETEKKPAIRIELPSGSYVPRFHFAPLTATSLPAPEVVPFMSGERSTAQGHGTSDPSLRAEVTEAPRPPDQNLWRAARIPAIVMLGLALIAVIGYAGFKRWFAGSNAQPEIRSIAILPLENLSGDPGQNYFADGMTDELIADLGQVSALRVISRTSAMSYKGTKKRLPEIARELAVEGVVEGSVLREGNQVRITAQLIDARTDRHLWAHTYVRDLTSVLALQGEVAQAIADEVSINVTPQEQARLARARPVNTEGQDLYLQGMLSLNAGDFKNALGYFQKAIDKDPNSAQAHAALADSYGWMGEAGWLAYTEAFFEQKTEAARAIELDDSLPEGHVELANAAMNLNWDWATAAKEFHRAQELNPNSASIHERYAVYLERTGKLQEAIAEVKRGVELDPVSGRSFRNAGFTYYFSRQYDEALPLIRRAQALNVSFSEYVFPLGDIYAEKGRYAESVSEFLKLGDKPHALGHLGNAYARAGKVDAARKTIAQLEEHVRKDGLGRYEIALVYAGLGERSEAFKWLEESYKAHDEGLTNLKIDPCLDPLRSDPRFDGLLRQVGLTL